ncbi:hypothetical protein O6H91_03G058800 [Diphasiastrum complanatum]|uniref:Uncharacterized protein n=2 Tax=Diphasiastrum complanatum TaxID=34168 RepID=A0ACC2E767_DIPCM|nr:hypothetical protein O6H91_03G058800 [Diphasiastrum complanatum]KAJ7562205.1 hypothetical protein O6H91_03G058800 [Diphasiastrum complanatum]
MQLRERKVAVRKTDVSQQKAVHDYLLSEEIQDSETAEFQSSDDISEDSSAEGTIALVAKRTRKVQASRRRLLKGSTPSKKVASSILQFAKANVVNTADIFKYSEDRRLRADSSDSDAFDSPPKRICFKRKRIVRSPSNDSKKPSRARTYRTSKKSYTEFFSSSDDDKSIGMNCDHSEECKADSASLEVAISDKKVIVKRISAVEKILAVKNRSSQSPIYCIKECGKSYRSVVYVLEALLQQHCMQLLRNFLRRMDMLQRWDGHPGDIQDGPAFDPRYLIVDRIIAKEQRGRKKHFLVKWKGLSYSESTWESEDSMQQEAEAIERFNSWNSKPSATIEAQSFPSAFKDGRTLREYQKEGLTWLEHNFREKMNCILADEMGLGKTIQSISMLESIRKKWRIRGPFLVIAPVSTLGHWQREIESLTDMNCVVYAGSQEDRMIIQEHEFHYPPSKTHDVKFNVLLTSFEILMKDQSMFSKKKWQYLIVDEAHRLKSLHSKTTCALKQMDFRKGGLLLLTGTPVQNNTKEIFSLLNLLDPEAFASEQEFLKKYGDIKIVDQVRDLQDNVLRPRLLRRMKEDVEKSIPQKEETIIWVELTKEQRAYYRAIYENRISDLLKGSKSNNLPNLRNMAMELRKLCNHPFLCDGLEEDLLSKQRAHGLALTNEEENALTQKVLTQSSGKMVLMDKILAMLRGAGRRVLIFSQFTIMLDILEDYLHSKGYSFERIDGNIRGSDRQAAIDRYSAKDSEIFVFLLSTRAGGLGITLTAADTCIIYDSDWNPQNDLQAMARCHRIGQTKDVRIYRLITRNTYEQKLFESSSLKYGLDEAILGSMVHADEDLSLNKNIESLLKHGAYDILKEDGEAQASEFSAQNIEQILEQRTEKRLIGGRGTNTFSVATFVANSAENEESKHDLEIESENFWHKMLPQACEAAEDAKFQHPKLEGRRKRTKVDYSERRHYSDEDSRDRNDSVHRARAVKHGREAFDDSELSESEDVKQWSEQEVKRLESSLLRFGQGRTKQIILDSRLESRNHAEVEQVIEVIIRFCHYFKAIRNSTPSLKATLGDGLNQSKDNLPQDSCARAPKIKLGGDAPSGEASEMIEPEQRELKNYKMHSSVPVHDLLAQEKLTIKGNLSHMELNLKDSNSKCNDQVRSKIQPPIVPSFAERALNSQSFSDRVKKNCGRYLQILHECKMLAEALSLSENLPPKIPRSFKMPIWWGPQEDLDLMKGAHKHGFRNFKMIKLDPSLGFARLILEQASKTSNIKEDIINDPLPLDAEGKLPTFEEQKHSNEWPSDAVLAGRLKRLIAGLSHVFPEVEIKHCIDKEPVQNYVTTIRNTCEKQHEEVHKLDKRHQASQPRSIVHKGPKPDIDCKFATRHKFSARPSNNALNSGQSHAASIQNGSGSQSNSLLGSTTSEALQAVAAEHEKTLCSTKQVARQNAYTPKLASKRDWRVIQGNGQPPSSDANKHHNQQHQASHARLVVEKVSKTDFDNTNATVQKFEAKLPKDALKSGQVHVANIKIGIGPQTLSPIDTTLSEALKAAAAEHEKTVCSTKHVARQNALIPKITSKRDGSKDNGQFLSSDIMVRSATHKKITTGSKPLLSGIKDKRFEVSGDKSKAAVTSNPVTSVYVSDSSSDDSQKAMFQKGSFRCPANNIAILNRLPLLNSTPIRVRGSCDLREALPSAPTYEARKVWDSKVQLSEANFHRRKAPLREAYSKSTNHTNGSLQRHTITGRESTDGSSKENVVPARKSLSLTSTVNKVLKANHDRCKQKTLLGFLAPKLPIKK